MSATLRQVALGLRAGSLGRVLGWAGLLALAAALALLPLGALLLGLGLALVVLLVARAPIVGACLAVLSVPIQELVLLPGGLSCTQAAVVAMALGWGIHQLRPGAAPLRLSRLSWAWAALLAALLLAASMTSYSISESLKETARWTMALLVWLVASSSIQSRRAALALLGCLLLAPGIDAAIGLAQFVSGDGPPSFQIAAGSAYLRAYGTIGQPNSFAGYLNMAWPLALALAGAATIGAWRQPRRWGWALGAWLIAALLLAGLAASFSRGGWIGAAAGLLAIGLALASGRRGARWLAVGLGLTVALVTAGAALGVLPAPIERRAASIAASLAPIDPARVAVTPENYAVVERAAQLQAGWRMATQHPLVGVGPGNFTPAYAAVTSPPWYVSKGHAHNYYLHMAAEAGLIGLAAYLSLIGAASYQAVTLVRRAQGTFWSSIGIGCCGMIAAVAAHNLFENLHVLNLGIQLAAGLALATAGILTIQAERTPQQKL